MKVLLILVLVFFMNCKDDRNNRQTISLDSTSTMQVTSMESNNELFRSNDGMCLMEVNNRDSFRIRVSCKDYQINDEIMITVSKKGSKK